MVKIPSVWNFVFSPEISEIRGLSCISQNFSNCSGQEIQDAVILYLFNGYFWTTNETLANHTHVYLAIFKVLKIEVFSTIFPNNWWMVSKNGWPKLLSAKNTCTVFQTRLTSWEKQFSIFSHRCVITLKTTVDMLTNVDAITLWCGSLHLYWRSNFLTI